MNTFQKLDEGFFDAVKGADPEVRKKYEEYEELKKKFLLALDTKVYNGDFEGAEELVEENMPYLRRAIEHIREANVPHSSDEMADYAEDYSYYNPMEEDNDTV